MKRILKQCLVAFLCGVVLGAGGAYWCKARFYHRWKGSGHFQEKMLSRFNEKLSLTPDQRDRVAFILAQKRSKIDALRQEMRPKFEEIRNGTRAEIRVMLTPEQQAKFDTMEAEREAHAKKWREIR